MHAIDLCFFPSLLRLLSQRYQISEGQRRMNVQAGVFFGGGVLDACVLYFNRLREKFTTGKSPQKKLCLFISLFQCAVKNVLEARRTTGMSKARAVDCLRTILVSCFIPYIHCFGVSGIGSHGTLGERYKYTVCSLCGLFSSFFITTSQGGSSFTSSHYLNTVKPPYCARYSFVLHPGNPRFLYIIILLRYPQAISATRCARSSFILLQDKPKFFHIITLP